MQLTLPQLEEYIKICSSPSAQTSNPEQFAYATNALNNLRVHHTATTIRQCIDLLDFTNTDPNRHSRQQLALHQIQFFALSTFQSGLQAQRRKQNNEKQDDDAERVTLKIRQSLMDRNGIYGAAMEAVPLYLRTKWGVVMAMLIQSDFPTRWPTCFDDLHEALFRTDSVLKRDLYLRTLDAISDEIVYSPHTDDRNTWIKDLMRGFTGNLGFAMTPPTHSKNSITGKLMEAMLFIAISSQGRDHLSVLALQVMNRYFSWVDLSLLIDQRMLQTIFEFLKRKDDMAVEAIKCLQELVTRGMEGRKKVRLVSEIHLFPNLSFFGNNGTTAANVNGMPAVLNLSPDNMPIELAVAYADILNTTGLELLQCWDDLLENLSEMSPEELIAEKDIVEINSMLLHQFMMLFLQFFSHPDIQVSGLVLPVALRMAITLGKETNSNKQQFRNTLEGGTQFFSITPHLPTLLSTIYIQIKYPIHYEFQPDDEEETDEEIYRNQLHKLQQKIIRTHPDMTLQFLVSALNQFSVPLSCNHWNELECGLRLLYHYSEGVKVGANIVLKNQTFQNVIVALHQSDISLHEHPKVLILYYEIATRYYTLFKTLNHAELLYKIMEAMTGSRGLQHPDSAVVNKVCYMMVRLVKSLGGKVMQPYVSTVISGIQGLLSSPTTTFLKSDDILKLFETMGLLLGFASKEGAHDVQQQYLLEILSPRVRDIEQVLQQRTNAPSSGSAALSESEDVVQRLSISIAAVAHLIKGFPKKQPPCQEIQIILVQTTLPMSLRVLECLPHSLEIRAKINIYLQVMLSTCGEKISSYLPHLLRILVEHATYEDFTEVGHLIINSCLTLFSSLSKDIIQALDDIFVPFWNKSHFLLSTSKEGDKDGSSSCALVASRQMERCGIYKTIYLVLYNIAKERITSQIFFHDVNIGVLEEVLTFMKNGVVEVGTREGAAMDPSMRKTCIVFFKELIGHWSLSDTTATMTNGSATNVSLNIPKQVQMAFIRFIYDTLLPGIISCILSKDFNERDAMQARNLSEMALLLSLFKADRGGADFCEQFVKRIACGYPNVGFGTATSAREMEDCLKRLIAIVKKK